MQEDVCQSMTIRIFKNHNNKHLDPDEVFEEIKFLREEVKSLQKAVALLRRDILWRLNPHS